MSPALQRLSDGTRRHRTMAWLVVGLEWFAAGTPAAVAQPTPGRPPAPQPRRVYPAPVEDTPESRLGADKTRKAERDNTTLRIDLLMSDPTQGLESQNWGRVFDALGYRVRARTGSQLDEPKLSEIKRGPLRTVELIGRIDRRGTLSFPGRTFQPGDERELKEWLEELEVYGAQGNPAGQPRWGLSTPQFQELFTSLADEITSEVTGAPLVDAVRSAGFTIEIPLRIDESAAEKWNSPLKAMQDVRGLSRGSALAVLLNDHGLCFRPVRTPAGTVELDVRAQSATVDPWPLGWEPRPDVQRSDYAPNLFTFGKIGFLDRPISETLAEARSQTGCAIVVDTPGVARKEIDLDQRMFGLPQKNSAWVLVLKSALTGTGLVSHIRVDEAGRGFVLVAPFDSKALSNR